MAQVVLASGSKVILDLTDGGVLSAYITCSQPRSQIYDTNAQTYSPDWAASTSHPVLTPSVFLDQESVALNNSHLTLTWKRREGNGAETNLMTGESVSGGVLTVEENKLGTANSGILTYVLTVRYLDASTGMDITVKTEFQFTLTRTGADGTSAYIMTLYAPKGTVFNNGTVDGGTSLTLNAQFYHGAVDITNNSNAYYLWQKLVNNAWVTAQSEAAGSSGSVLTVNASDVTNAMNYRCRAKYGSTSTTYFYDTITVVNKTDNYQATVESTAGDVFPNGSGETVLVARVWQAGAEVDPQKSTTYSSTAPSSPETGTYYYKINSGTPTTQVMRYSGTAWVDVTSDPTYGHIYSYTWRRYDSDGEPLDPVTPYATGKVIHVTGVDVDGITTFVCEVGTVATAQFTIRDDNDIVIASEAPLNPATNMLWLDTGITPNVLKKYNGTAWQIVNDTSAIYTTINNNAIAASEALQQALSAMNNTVETKIAEAKMSDSEFSVIFGRTVEQGIATAIQGVQGNLSTYQTSVANYMRFDESGTLTLGKTDSNFQTQLTNTKMSFLEGNSEVAYISNQSMYISTARITEALSLGTDNGYGYFDWTVTPTGLGLKWRDPGYGGIKVTMLFDGLSTVPSNFQMTNNYNSTVFTASNASAGDGINTPFEWVINNIREGTYILFTQSGADVSGYTWEGDQAKMSESILDEIVITLPFVNTYTAT